MIVFYLVIWYALGIMCVECLNGRFGDADNWSSESRVIKFLIITVAPLAYLMIATKEGIKK